MTLDVVLDDGLDNEYTLFYISIYFSSILCMTFILK